MERKPKFKKGQKVQMVLNKYDNPIHAHHVGEVFVVKEVMEEYHDNDKTNIVFSYNIQNDDEVGLLCEEGELKAIEDKPIDMVNSPKHYCDLIEDYECYEVMKLFFGEEAFIAHCKCNALKYIWRHDKKGGQEDLKKAKWYLDKVREYNHKHNIKDISFENLNKMTER